eukprot:TRINITY_DN31856_c0_g1_i2.p1 TRINITY_DN31856_c0_g1~~TRINITY_DN31856_c0_g1_i2.p1  ORF type:complete len:372 (+),score=95.85 TRINITY_DN31856_c0_g1_i2:51-1166(+)
MGTCEAVPQQRFVEESSAGSGRSSELCRRNHHSSSKIRLSGITRLGLVLSVLSATPVSVDAQPTVKSSLASDAPLDGPPPTSSPPSSSGGASSSSNTPVALRLVSSVRSTTPEALQQEIVAAEEALSLRAEVDGLPVVYDSPAVSIVLRKVSAANLTASGADLEAPDGASIKIPADPRVKGRTDRPVTVTVTSYHAGDAIKELPTVKYGKNRTQVPQGAEAVSKDDTPKDSAPDSNVSSNETQKEERVDFFMSKTSVSWRGTVNVKVPGLAAQVPAHDRPWSPYGRAGEDLYPEEKAEVRKEMERLASLPSEEERSRALRRLARQWHPDKHPAEDKEKATEVFEYLQDLRDSYGLGVQQRPKLHEDEEESQ